MAKLAEVESHDFQRNMGQIHMQVKWILALLSYNQNHIKANKEEGRGVIFKGRKKMKQTHCFPPFSSFFFTIEITS